NLASEVISDHEPEQNESSITFSPRSDPIHHKFVGELLTLPSRNDREFGEYLSLMTVLCEISTSQSQENVHANQNDLIPPGVENDDSEDEDNELPNLDHQDDPLIPRPPPEPPDVKKCFEPEIGLQKSTRLFHRKLMSLDYYSPDGVSKAIINLPHDGWDAKKKVINWGQVNQDVLAKLGTDISKITRKQSKTGKHGHEKWKSTREAKDSEPKPEKMLEGHVAMKKAQGEVGFTLISLTQLAQAVTSKE
ncbi:hypothetical protein Tco_0604791, partial [Tanacetum coccineum]